MNGVLEGEETQPEANWGDYPDAGVNLSGAKRFSFWAKGKNGGELVEFFAFGVGTGTVTKPYPDSSKKKFPWAIKNSPKAGKNTRAET